jgi:hypothetical protein
MVKIPPAGHAFEPRHGAAAARCASGNSRPWPQWCPGPDPGRTASGRLMGPVRLPAARFPALRRGVPASTGHWSVTRGEGPDLALRQSRGGCYRPATSRWHGTTPNRQRRAGRYPSGQAAGATPAAAAGQGDGLGQRGPLSLPTRRCRALDRPARPVGDADTGQDELGRRLLLQHLQAHADGVWRPPADGG